MVNATMTNRHWRPVCPFVSTTQYLQAANSYYTDGSGQTALDRIKNLEMIEDVVHLPPTRWLMPTPPWCS